MRMRALRVSITSAHIRDGIRGSACDCPIALALKDSLITTNVTVRSDAICVNGYRFDVDKKDRKFIERFDEGKRVKPYWFELVRKGR